MQSMGGGPMGDDLIFNIKFKIKESCEFSASGLHNDILA